MDELLLIHSHPSNKRTNKYTSPSFPFHKYFSGLGIVFILLMISYIIISWKYNPYFLMDVDNSNQIFTYITVILSIILITFVLNLFA
jgi:hypothetical protein